MTRRATLIASVTTRSQLERVEQLASAADILEIRADLVGDVDVDHLRNRFSGELLYTLRSAAEGGAGPGSGETRRARLRAAAGFDLVDLEAARDLDGETLGTVPAERRLVSWHGPSEPSEALRERLGSMRGAPARWYKLVPSADRSGEEFGPLVLSAELRARDVIAFCSGEVGRWTRILAPRLGAPVVYAALPGGAAAPGQIELDRGIADYGLPNLGPVEALFGIVGQPVGHSLSPRLHNLGYRSHGLPFGYVPFEVASFADFWLEVAESGRLEFLGSPLRGLSITAPHKATAAAVAGAVSPVVDRLDSANTLVRRSGVWEGETTDPHGVLVPLRERAVDLRGLRAAVIGAGGAGRAAAWGLARAGARITLVNRSLDRGAKAARDLGVEFVALDAFRPAGFSVLVHATSLGRDAGDLAPFEVAEAEADAILIDLVYLPDRPTPLLEAGRRHGLATIDGREVLLAQARSQFRLMTGRELPLAESRDALQLEPRS